MVKILMGLVAAVAIAVGGFFGFQFYTQHRIAGEVEATFEQLRAAGGKASHGEVSFDLRSRTLKIADIAINRRRSRRCASKLPASSPRVSVSRNGAILRRQHRSVGSRDRRQHGRSGGREARLQSAADRREGLFRPRQPAAAIGFGIHRRRISIRIGAVRHRLGDIDLGPEHYRDNRLRRCHVGRVRLYGYNPAGHQGRQDRHHAGRAGQLYGQHATGRQSRQDDGEMPNLASATSMPPRPPPSSIRKRRTTIGIAASMARRQPAPTRSLLRKAFACAWTR